MIVREWRKVTEWKEYEYANIKHFLLAVTLILMLISNASAMPKVILTFDDGRTSVYYKTLPIMQSNNQKGVSFVITGEVAGASGEVGMEYMNITQLYSLYSAGWDLSSHTVTHPDLTTLSSSALNTELGDSKNWLNNSGFKRGSQFLAYPYGAYNADVITSVINNDYLAARTVNDNNGLYPQYYLTDPTVFEMNTLMISGVPGHGRLATPVSYVKNEINQTITTNGLLIISFHNIIDSGLSLPEDYLTSDFKSISDFLKSKENSGQLNVVTMSEYFGTTLPTATPVAECGADKLGCENVGAPVQFNGSASYDPDGTISSYAWDFGDGTNGTGAAPNHTYSSYRWNGSGYQPFIVNLTVTDNSSLTNKISQNVMIWIAGDANGDGKVNILDASVVGLKWNGNDPCADLNNDGKVNILDASIIGLNWGKIP